MTFSPGDVVLIPLSPFSGGPAKLRPALLLASLPGPYQTQLVCGVSTQLHQQVPDWDELIQPGDADFPSSGLHRESIIRLSYLHATDLTEFAGASRIAAHAGFNFRCQEQLWNNITLSASARSLAGRATDALQDNQLIKIVNLEKEETKKHD